MPEFEYKTRKPSAHMQRANQSQDTVFSRNLDVGPPVAPESSEGEVQHRRNYCVCGHAKKYHCTDDPLMHWPSSEGEFGFYFCLSEHCECFTRENGQSIPCPCIAFRASEAAILKLKRPSVNDFTSCARCGHEKGLHCKASRQKSQAGVYQGFRIHGEPYPCSHTLLQEPYVCNTAHCAAVVRLLGTDENGSDLGEFCDCPKFVNPLLRKRTTKPNNSSARKPRKKE